jgi:hypothetical protein
MTKPGEPVDFTFIEPTPEALEAQARSLAPLEVRALPGNCMEWTTAFGVSLMVPDDLEPQPTEDPGDACWQNGESCSLSVSLHEGAGQFVSFLGSDDDDFSAEEEGEFHISLAGRVGRVELSRIGLAEHEYYFAAASAMVGPGRIVAVSVFAPTAELRARLLAVIPTVRFEPPGEGQNQGIGRT